MKTINMAILCVSLALLGCEKNPIVSSVNTEQLVMSFDTEENMAVYQWSFLPGFSSVETKNIQLGGQDYQGTIIKGLSENGELAIGEPIAVFYVRKIGTDLDIYILCPVPIHLDYPKEKIKIYDMYKEQQINDPVLKLPLGIYRFNVSTVPKTIKEGNIKGSDTFSD